MVSLVNVPVGKVVIVKGFAGGRGMVMRLMQLGIHPGDRIRVLSIAPFGGAIFIENLTSGGKVAIGRGIARRIIVDYV